MKYVLFFLNWRQQYSVIFLLWSGCISAQSIWLANGARHNIAFEIMRPDYKNVMRDHVDIRQSFRSDFRFGYPTRFVENAMYPVDYATFNTVLSFLTYSRPLRKMLLLKAELPYASTNFDIKLIEDYSFFRYNGHENTFGNPYLGVQIQPLRWFSANAGMRLPLLSKKFFHITDVCAFTVPDRIEAFHINASMKLGWSLQLRSKAGFGAQLETEFLSFFPRGHYRKPWWNFPACLSIGIDNKRMTLQYILYLRYNTRIHDYRDVRLFGLTGLTAALQIGKLRAGAQASLTIYETYRILNTGLHFGYQLE